MTLVGFIDFISDLLTIGASCVAIYLFFSQRKNISIIFKILLGYSHQLTLSELKEKIEKLTDLNSDVPTEKIKIIYLINDILGQVSGNSKLSGRFSTISNQINKFNKDPSLLTEPRKRALTSEIRERIRHLHVQNMDELTGE